MRDNVTVGEMRVLGALRSRDMHGIVVPAIAEIYNLVSGKRLDMAVAEQNIRLPIVPGVDLVGEPGKPGIIQVIELGIGGGDIAIGDEHVPGRRGDFSDLERRIKSVFPGGTDPSKAIGLNADSRFWILIGRIRGTA